MLHWLQLFPASELFLYIYDEWTRLVTILLLCVHMEDLPHAIPGRTIVYCLKQWPGTHLPHALCKVISLVSGPYQQEPDWKVCLARLISLSHTLNFSRGSSHKIFVKQQKETIELLFSDTNTAAQGISM